MKTIIIKSIVIFLIFCGISSCEEFLEETPYDRLTTKNFYLSEDDAQASVYAIYNKLYNLYERLMFLVSELPCDVEKNGRGMPNQYLQNLEFLRHTPENTFVRQMWQHNYSGISRANDAITNIPNVSMDESKKNHYIAEARFLRALFYFNLVRFFGDVPLVTELKSIEDAMVPRSPKEDVYNLIIDDLTFAESNLPVSYNEKNDGRVTKGAAKILLGKVYLTKPNYQEAVNKLAEIVNNETNYGYGLHEDFHDNWNPATEAGIENVLRVNFGDPPLNGNGAMQLQNPKYSVEGGAGIGTPGGYEADIPTEELYNLYSEDDERKSVTFQMVFENVKTGQIFHSTIPIFTKYFEEGETNANNSDCDFFILRYADALLMYAEALNEINQTTQALLFLNRVRERAFNNTDHNYNGLTQQEFREAVWLERHLEFAQEGHRFFDLVRTGRFVDRMREHSQIEATLAESNKTEIANNLKDYMILMPIPQHEIDLNPELVQNPGWK